MNIWNPKKDKSPQITPLIPILLAFPILS